MGVERAFLQETTRRALIGGVAGASLITLLAACSRSQAETDNLDDEREVQESDSEQADDDADENPESPDSDAEDSETDPAPDGPADDDDDEPADVDTESTDGEPTAEEQNEPDVASEDDTATGDVLEYQFSQDGAFGSVTLRLHEASVDDGTVTFIRTAASDAAFAEQEGVPFVPRLANVLDAPGGYGELYLFAFGPAGQRPVMSVSPSDSERYSPALRVNHVMIVGKTGVPLTSQAEILAAEEIGNVQIEVTNIIVNYPQVTWTKGQLAVDAAASAPFGSGQLLDQPDFADATVTFKLHPGYPDSWFIMTAVSDADIGQSAGIVTSEALNVLADAGAASSITAIRGTSEAADDDVYQPAILETSATDSQASPFCEYHSVEWTDGASTVEVTSFEHLNELIDSGELVRLNADSESEAEVFVANCPVVVTGVPS